MRKENICQNMQSMFEGSDISCRAYDDDTCICPKSRNRFRI